MNNFMNKKMKWFVLLACVAGLGIGAENGCDNPPPDKKVAVDNVPAQQVEGARFDVEQHGTFRAGHENAVRQIIIVTDKETGQKYLGITDCSLVRLQAQKNAETVNTILDTVSDIDFGD
jgi:hypothetical protein